MRVKYPRILRADGVRNAPLDLQQLGAVVRDQRADRADLFRQFFCRNCPKRHLRRPANARRPERGRDGRGTP